ncbi:MAG: hypothetical protein K0S14_1265 [Thermomicrobiales bacterium]|nr:hypothetical protein [Thermomicrobiales bacterium]
MMETNSVPQTAEVFVIDQFFDRPIIAAHRVLGIGAEFQRIDFHRRAATILPRLTLSLFSARPDFTRCLSPPPKDNAHMVRGAVIGELDMHAAWPERYAIELD